MFNITHPLFLLLLLWIPVLVFVLRQTKVASAKWRRWGTLCLRGGAIFCAVLAVANLQRTHQEQKLALIFLIDMSDSVSKSEQTRTLKQINAAVEKLKPDDIFGIIGFAQERFIMCELRPKSEQPSLEPMRFERTVAGAGTDILAALKYAIALLPESYQRRVVLFSDGIHNAGGTALIDYLPLIQASNVELLTVPLQTAQDAFQVHQLQMPTQLRKGQRFSMVAIVETDGSIPDVTATLYHNGVPSEVFEWTLPSGKHRIELPTRTVLEAKPQDYQLKLNVTDTIPENNQAYQFIKVQDKPQVIYVEEMALIEKQNLPSPLEPILKENGFDVETISPAEMPDELITLQQSDVLILNNISADAFSTKQLKNIENYVRDMGLGLVVIGGERAFAPGGYTDTALERVLPVDMTPRQRKESVALFFVIDISGSMANYVETQQKIQLAIEGVGTGVRNLKDEDVAGIIGFNTDVYLISPLTSEHGTLRQAAANLRPTGGTTQMKEALHKAGEILKAADAKTKHIILLSDGKSEGEYSEFLNLASELTETRIGITAIALGDADKTLLKDIADVGGGRFRYVQNVQELPIVLMETVKETQRYIVQEPFQPILSAPDAPVLKGIGMPPLLHGYVATAEKEYAQVLIRSHRDEPILAAWNFGLGKAVAWTSDVNPAWAREWLQWDNFGRFWGQVLNWTAPPEHEDADFEINVSVQNGQGEVTLDTLRPSQEIYHVHVAGAGGRHDIAHMRQITPTRYIGNFKITNSGAYIVTAQRESDARKRTETLSFAYPAEYAELHGDFERLKTLGIYEPSVYQMVQHSGEPIENRISLTWTLLFIALTLFICEMFVRQFTIASGYFSELRARLHRETAQNVPEMFTRLTEKKADVLAASNRQGTRTIQTKVALKTPYIQNRPETEAGRDTPISRLLKAKRKVHED